MDAIDHYHCKVVNSINGRHRPLPLYCSQFHKWMPSTTSTALLPRSKVFVHLFTWIKQFLNEIAKITMRVLKTTFKKLSFATKLISVATSVWKWHRFKDDVSFLKTMKQWTCTMNWSKTIVEFFLRYQIFMKTYNIYEVWKPVENLCSAVAVPSL